MAHREPYLFVVFGGAGDLMQRKLLPALLRLYDEKKLGDDLVLLAVSRRDWSDDRYRECVRGVMDQIDLHSKRLDAWCKKNVYFQVNSDDATRNYGHLKTRIEKIERDHGLSGGRVFYLAIPPGAFPGTVQGLGKAGLSDGPSWTRVVVEKPFGRDVESARKLNDVISNHFDESQIYRIDHFLGKETVQNLAVFRFANMIFESAWNRNRIDNVQITVAEDLGVMHRADYYDKAGALRDMIQNHLTQILTLIAMDAPSKFTADAVRDEKLRVLRSIAPIGPEDAVFGQYRAGRIDGREVRGYRAEEDVAEGSKTETYTAIRLSIENWRWQGVPFYLRTGKRLAQTVTEIAIVFKRPPIFLFQPLGPCSVKRDVLRIRMQPDEVFKLSFDVKVPGAPLRVEQHELEFSYADAFDELADAYHTLILDIIDGDQTHFVRADEVEAAWKVYAPLLEHGPDPFPYAAGTWGPAEADRLVESNGARWAIG